MDIRPDAPAVASGAGTKVKKNAPPPAEFKRMFGERVTTASLYTKLRQMAADHRTSAAPPPHQSEAQRFALSMETDPAFAAAVLHKVRVAPIKTERGDPRGAGLDELLKTSYTLEWFKRAAGMTQAAATSTVDNSRVDNERTTFDWLDLQQYVRAGTETVVFNDGHGHVGALWLFRRGRPGGQFATQDQFHKERNRAILNASTPLQAYREALLAHIKLTGNREEVTRVLTQKHLYDVRGRSSAVPEQRKQMVDALMDIRDQWKRTYSWLGGDVSRLPKEPIQFGPAPRNPNVADRSFFQDVPLRRPYGNFTG